MRSFKKIAAMIMAVAMLCSFTALAATVTLEDIADVASNAPAVEFNYTSDASQNTILAYAGTQLAGANIVYIDQIAKGATIPEFALDANGPYGTYTVVVGGTDVATAATKTFEYTDATPKYDVTLTSAANGVVDAGDAALEDVREGSVITLKIVPYLGYELTSFKVNEVEEVSAAADGSFELKVEADTTVTAVFTEIAVDEENGNSITYPEMFDIDETVADDNAPSQAPAKSKLTFGQAQVVAGKDITSMGMHVEVWDETANEGAGAFVGFTTKDDPATAYNESVGPKFAAARWTAEMKYGIRFFSFPEGRYKVWSYVDYSDGSSVEGTAIEFTVE